MNVPWMKYTSFFLGFVILSFTLNILVYLNHFAPNARVIYIYGTNSTTASYGTSSLKVSSLNESHKKSSLNWSLPSDIVTGYYKTRSKETTLNVTSAIQQQLQKKTQDKIINPHEYSYLINQPNACEGNRKNVTLLVIVCSAMSTFEQRLAIRQSWGSYLKENLTSKLIFLLGSGEDSELQEKIEKESTHFNDIVQESFIDSYRNLSIKSVAALKWMQNYCKSARYVFKVDDDIFVNIPNLLRSLEKQHHPKFIMGHIFYDAEPIRDKNSKWFASKQEYPGKVYPSYVSGTSYLVSRQAAIAMYNASLYIPLFYLEDVYITGLCAKKANVKLIHNPDITYGTRKNNGCAYIDAINGHHVTYVDMYKIYAQLQMKNLNCRKDELVST